MTPAAERLMEMDHSLMSNTLFKPPSRGGGGFIQIKTALKGRHVDSCTVQEILRVSYSFSRREAESVESNQRIT